MDTAQPLNNVGTLCQGAGQIDLKLARNTAETSAGRVRQSHTAATGSGSLESARGTIHVYDETVALAGEQDIMGTTWSGYCTNKGKKTTCADTLWDGGDFNGASWSGASWSGASWSGASRSGASWSGASWSGASWSGNVWNGLSWE